MKHLLKWFKILITGIIWSVIYGYTLIPLTQKFYYVNLLNPKDYKRLTEAFTDGRWQINSFADFVLLFLIFGFIPLWITGWIFFYRKFSKLKTKHFSFKKKVKIDSTGKLTGLPQRKAFVPEKMRTQASSLLNISLEEAQQTLKTSTQSVSNKQSGNTSPLSEEEISYREADIALISKLAENYEVEVFSNLLFAGEHLPIAISTDERAALIWLINTPNETWSVDTSESIEQAPWYGTTKQIPSPVGILKKISTSLSESEPDSEVIPLIVLTSGHILNESETLSACQEANIQLATFGTAESQLIPTLKNILDKLFVIKGQTKPEISFDHLNEDTSEINLSPTNDDIKTQETPAPPPLILPKIS